MASRPDARAAARLARARAACCARPASRVVEPGELTEARPRWLATRFMTDIYPVLTPLAIDPAHPFPFIPNLGFALALQLKRKDGRDDGRADPDSAARSRASFACRSRRRTATRGVDGALHHAREHRSASSWIELFPGYEVVGRGCFRVLRDSDIEVAEEAEDLVRVVRRRAEAAPARQRDPPQVRSLDAGGSARLHRRSDGSERARAGERRRHFGPCRHEPADPSRAARPDVHAVQCALSGAHPRFRRRLLRRDPGEGSHRPSSRSSRSTSSCSSCARRRPIPTSWRSSRRSIAPATTRRS